MGPDHEEALFMPCTLGRPARSARSGRLGALLQILRRGAALAVALRFTVARGARRPVPRPPARVGVTGDWAPWNEFLALVIHAEARSGHDRTMRLLALQQDLSQKVGAACGCRKLGGGWSGGGSVFVDEFVASACSVVRFTQRREGRIRRRRHRNGPAGGMNIATTPVDRTACAAAATCWPSTTTR
jgi:hypothetical protein